MTDFEKYLKIFKNRSEYHTSLENKNIFKEGVLTKTAKQRRDKVQKSFKGGFLEEQIEKINEFNAEEIYSKLPSDFIKLLVNLVDSITSERGRAIVALTVMQLSIKTIVREQDIRLHKGGMSKKDFSWEEGISMRALDKRYVAPALRKSGLLSLNKDGFMMTRSLAENYPYTLLYKAMIRGAKEEWLSIIDLIQKDEVEPDYALKYLLFLLSNKAAEFTKLAENVLNKKKRLFQNAIDITFTKKFMMLCIEKSDHAARIFEITIHSLMQAVTESGMYPDYTLQPLSQMRSANKKHGNIGDIELLDGKEICIAWDAKFGKSYLRDELDEISEKLGMHNSVKKIGFITNDKPMRDTEIKSRLSDIENLYNLKIEILTFDDWVQNIIDNLEKNQKNNIAEAWLTSFIESIAQKKRAIAPIDEPCLAWLKTIDKIIDSYI